jgi:U3 small nucleolar RNA-associated protein 23
LDEEKRLNMDIIEYKKLMKAASEGKSVSSENGSDGEQHERPISSLVKSALGAADKTKFKRNRAKVIFTVFAFF